MNTVDHKYKYFFHCPRCEVEATWQTDDISDSGRLLCNKCGQYMMLVDKFVDNGGYKSIFLNYPEKHKE